MAGSVISPLLRAPTTVGGEAISRVKFRALGLLRPPRNDNLAIIHKTFEGLTFTNLKNSIKITKRAIRRNV